MSKDKKLQLADIKFDLVEEILNNLFDLKQKDDNREFDCIWNEIFTCKFNDSVCEKNSNNEYSNEIIKIIYDNCKLFYENGCDEITRHIKETTDEINKIWNNK